MTSPLYPYVIFLPKGRKQKVLRAIFGSSVPIDILRFAVHQGVSNKIYQRDLISKLHYSNRTIITHLKTLTDLNVLEEDMEKIEAGGRVVWLKSYKLTDLGKWFALLLVEEETLTRERKVEIVLNALRYYTRWIRILSEKLGIDKKSLKEIFNQEMR